MPQLTRRSIASRFSPAGFEHPTFRGAAQVARAAKSALDRRHHPVPTAAIGPAALRHEITRLAALNRRLGGTYTVPPTAGLTSRALRGIAAEIENANTRLREVPRA